MQHILSFIIENQQFAIDLAYVEKVISAVETTYLPNAPNYIKGAINIHGKVISVIDLRQIFSFSQKDVELSDQFIICRIIGKSVALCVDNVKGVRICAENDLIPIKEIYEPKDFVDFVTKYHEEIVLIVNLERLVSEELSLY